MVESDTAVIPEAFRPDVEKAVHILKAGGCAEVFVFGSLVEGNARADSDIDLAVRGCPPNRFFNLLGKLMWELEHRVDLIDLDAPDPLAQWLRQRGGLLHVG